MRELNWLPRNIGSPFGPHGQIAGLHLQHGLREPHVAGRDDRQVAVVLLVDRVGSRRACVSSMPRAAFDLHGFRELADLHA